MCWTLFSIAVDDSYHAYLGVFTLLTVLFYKYDSSFHLSDRLQNIVSYIDAHSYALYLMHTTFNYSVVFRAMQWFTTWEVGMLVILGWLVATWIGHNLIEIPIQRMLMSRKRTV